MAPGGDVVSKAIYRSVLQYARRFDSNMAAKVQQCIVISDLNFVTTALLLTAVSCAFVRFVYNVTALPLCSGGMVSELPCPNQIILAKGDWLSKTPKHS